MVNLQFLDWLVIGAYAGFALTVGLLYTRRASKSVDEFFLSGRTLPWWLAGTSMVATSFAADTPLLISGWVRSDGIWKNWAWWCFAASGMLGTFLFARWWRRGGVMTKAELAELRYGGTLAKELRAFLGIVHAFIMNPMILCWVMLAAAKILGVLFGLDKWTAVVLASSLALSYSLLSGLWGVVFTDFVQFIIAVVGAIALAVLSWNAVGGGEGVLAAAADGTITASTLRFWPEPGADDPNNPWAWWTAPVAAVAVYLGVSWWAVENIDGSGASVQRIAATRDERQGMLAVLWFNVLHYAVRPWPWIMVGLASLVVLPQLEPVTAPLEQGQKATVVSIDSEERRITLAPETGAPIEIDLAMHVVADAEEEEPKLDWIPRPQVSAGQEIEGDHVLGKEDPERAYVVMMTRFLPVGLLGLVVASLLAAFMSTIDTHVNLSSSFFVNDLYRRYINPDGSPTHYVAMARVGSVIAMALGALLTLQVNSISELFLFFLAFLGGVGPVYILRWLWWRITARTEIVAVLTSGISTFLISHAHEWFGVDWQLGPLSNDGEIAAEARLIMVAGLSLVAALGSLIAFKPPRPEDLVPFYTKVRPLGAWGPVRALVDEDVRSHDSIFGIVLGIAGGLALIFGTLFATGQLLLGATNSGLSAAVAAVAGGIAVAVALGRMTRS